MLGRTQKRNIPRFGSRDALSLAWVLLVILLFLSSVIYPAFIGKRHPHLSAVPVSTGSPCLCVSVVRFAEASRFLRP
jgi:hypothetical protein